MASGPRALKHDDVSGLALAGGARHRGPAIGGQEVALPNHASRIGDTCSGLTHSGDFRAATLPGRGNRALRG